MNLRISGRRCAEVFIALSFIALIFTMHQFSSSSRERIARTEHAIESLKDDVLAALAEGDFTNKSVEIEGRIAAVQKSGDLQALIGAYDKGSGARAAGMRFVRSEPSGGLSGVANSLYALDFFVDSVALEQQAAADTLSTLMLALSVIFMGMFFGAEVVTARRLSRMKHRRELEAGLVAAIERERDLIALDLHDSVLQKLGFVGQQLEDRHGNCERVTDIRNLVGDSIRELRDLYAGLRREDRGETEPEARLTEIIEEFRSLGPISLETSVFGLEPSLLPPSSWHHVVRIAQELLSNGYKHARARKITLRMYSLPGALRILYADDGIGYSGTVPPRLGSVEYRCAILGASPHFSRTGSGAGFSVKIEVPLS